MRTAIWVVTIAMIALAGGCVVGGALAYKLAPDPTVPAEYKPAQQPTLVLVENYENPDLYQVHADRLSHDLCEQLTANKVAPILGPGKLSDLQAREGASFHKMNLPQVARALGARQVVYVDLVKFSVSPPPGSDMLKGEAEARVRVVDDAGHTLWPADSSMGRDIKFETPFIHVNGQSESVQVQERVYQALSTRIGRLFYSWKSEQVDGSEPDHAPIDMDSTGRT